MVVVVVAMAIVLPVGVVVRWVDNKNVAAEFRNKPPSCVKESMAHNKGTTDRNHMSHLPTIVFCRDDPSYTTRDEDNRIWNLSGVSFRVGFFPSFFLIETMSSSVLAIPRYRACCASDMFTEDRTFPFVAQRLLRGLVPHACT